MKKILVVDDDLSFNELISNYLRKQDFIVSSVFNPQDALQIVQAESFDLVLSDYKLPGIDGLTLIDKINKTHPNLPVILITNYADIRLAVNSIKLGAFEFVTKPVIPDELLKIVSKALHKSQMESSSNEIENDKKYVVGKNADTIKLWEHLTTVSPTKINVLITGESGTGKEHIARTIHEMSRRNNKPFVSIDCGALSANLAASELFGHVKGAFTGALSDKKGLFEEAHGGTLFLDEIGNLSYDVQVLLLRALQEGTIKRVGGNREIKVDVRLVAATNEQLNLNVEKGIFRNDLYHRLNEFELYVPPLRKRLDDLNEFCAFFINEACRELDKPPMSISDNVLNLFEQYSWPGNLRELKNIIRRSVLLTQGDLITEEVLPYGLKVDSENAPLEDSQVNSNELNIKEQIQEKEKKLIVDALQKYQYNKTKAANALNIDRSTLYSKIKQYNIEF